MRDEKRKRREMISNVLHSIEKPLELFQAFNCTIQSIFVCMSGQETNE